MKKVNEHRALLCAAGLLLLPFSVGINSAHADELIDAISKSKVTGNLRLRYESVDVDSPTVKDATALTLRTRLGIETAPLSGFTGIVEFEDTRVVGGKDNYSPEYKNPAKPANNPYDYAAIVDPEVTEVNRAYLRYRGIPKLDLGLGRQRLIYDNQRFIGNVGWRQDEQTYDAFSASYAGIADWNFMYAYVDRVNGIANVKPLYNFNLDTSDNLFNVTYSGFVLGKITAYAYLLDNQEDVAILRNTGTTNKINPALRYQSNDTYGLRFDGSYVLPSTVPLRLFYTAEYAKQSLTTPTDVDFDTKYTFFETGLGYTSSVGVLSAKVAQQVMGSDKVNGVERGFQTPYATKHAFNGWDDMFLNTPDSGLKDKFATLAADLQPYGVKVMAIHHRFSKDSGGGDFGKEWDFQVLKQFGANYTLGIKYASYKADDATTTNFLAAANIDTKKFWVWGELTF